VRSERQVDAGLVAFAAALVAVLVGWNNVFINRVPSGRASYVVANLAATCSLLFAARRAGLATAELGLARRRLPAGLRWGGACAAIVGTAYLIAVLVPSFRPLLTDDRVGGLDGGQLAYRVLVRIPLGTVLWEEVAFRGVLLAVLARLLPMRAAVAVSAVVFGIWHVRPTLGALEAYDVAAGPLLTSAAVVLACAGTAIAGAFFAWLRLRSGSLLAPVLLHLATNSLGTLAAAAAFALT
jgi:membrane protease YdiL (CAAX protease family)